LKFAASRFGNELPAGGSPGEAEAALQVRCHELVAELRSHLQNMEFRKATEALNALWSAGNQYIDVRAPWTIYKQDKEEAAAVIRTAVNLIRLYAVAASPFIPSTAEQIFDALQLTEAERRSPMGAAADLNLLTAGRTFQVPPVLIQKIDDDRVAELKAQYGGD
jgi:methionyl-tRNA synthetase